MNKGYDIVNSTSPRLFVLLMFQKLLLLLAFQIISGHVWARFSSYPGIPTPRCKRGRLHSDFVGFDMYAESLCV